MSTRFNQFGHYFPDADGLPRIYGDDFRFANLSLHLPGQNPTEYHPTQTYTGEAQQDFNPRQANLLQWFQTHIAPLFNLTGTT